MGLGMFQRLRNLDEIRNRTYTLIEELKSQSLLLDGSNEHCVQMHDVVRDIALYIASEEKRGGFVINLDQPIREDCYENYVWISMTNLSNKTEFPVEIKCPSLRLLTMKSGNKKLYDDEMRLPDRIFDGMQEVRVLFMEEIHIRSLPSTTQLLKNLKTLYLFNCQVLESIGIVGELLKLEILCCIDCYNIRALPREIGRLNRLMLLEIIHCRNLKRIAPGITSNLINLEELKIKCSFNGWEAKKNNARENAALVELESLTKLRCLELEINNVSSVAEEIRLPSGIVNHSISLIIKERDSYFFMQERDSLWDHYFSKMCLEIPGQMNVGNWIKTLVRFTEFLDLKGDGATEVLVGLNWNLKSLTLRSCSLVKKLLNTSTSAFPSLESLTLAYLDNLVEIFPPKPDKYSCFKNLRTISIEGCPRLRFLFSVSEAIMFLTQLQDLTVIDCEAVEDMIIFSDDDDDDDKMEKDGEIRSHNLRIGFPKLSCLKLAGLPRLILAQETLSKEILCF
ncbi:hypothetical protein CDL12_01609 [Handroanthus impetiginosus]|uniref:Disease resistance protein At4g27190-like leucine-rich repeats domain-containing protein n=1 Tax=Handroanthus impetiginosus TaxID=429701 RepID=A0A2G9I7A8_9LAMI|nr:hypothetical protein CDL12_01609 [Handroanthus impetiginosus]